jgi:subtilisin family serine protease
MNKRLLYGGAAVSLIAIIYFNLTNIANWWVARKDAQAIGERPLRPDSLPYVKGQLLVFIPKNQDSAATLTKRLKGLKFKQKADCGCTENITLWENDDLADVPLIGDPDDVPPDHLRLIREMERQKRQLRQDTTPNPYDFNGYKVLKNYRMVTQSNFSRVRKPLATALQRYPTFMQNAPEVLVAILDSGVDTTAPGVYPSLHKNTGSAAVCRPPFAEGVYGWNVVNRINDPLKREPLATDEECFNFFSVRRGHGTLINGIAAGMSWYPNQVDFANTTNVNLKLLNVRLYEKNKVGSDIGLFDVLCGLNYAIEKGAKVINCSFHIPANAISAAVARSYFLSTLTKLKAANAHLIASAGNEGTKGNASFQVFPAAFSRDADFGGNVIAVGGWDTGDNLIATTSNEGNYIDVYAPGQEIRMYNRLPPQNWWRSLFTFEQPDGGTSFSAAFVSREAALLRGLSGNSTPAANIKASLMLPPHTQVSSGVKVFTPYR